MKHVLRFAAATEAATGLALLFVPSLVGRLLLGEELSGVAVAVARVLGIALIALGIACWPGAQNSTPAGAGMLAYNALIALYLGSLGIAGLKALLLWPAAILHAVVALLLVWTMRKG